MATPFRIPGMTVEGATVSEPLDKLKAPPHPIDELRAARRDLLVALLADGGHCYQAGAVAAGSAACTCRRLHTRR